MCDTARMPESFQRVFALLLVIVSCSFALAADPDETHSPRSNKSDTSTLGDRPSGETTSQENSSLPASFWAQCKGTRFASMHVVTCKSGLRLSWGQHSHKGPVLSKDERLHFGMELPPNGCSNQLNSISGATLYALKVEPVDLDWPDARGVTWKDTLETTAVSASFVNTKKETETLVACTAPNSAKVSCLDVVRSVGAMGLPSQLSFSTARSAGFLGQILAVPTGCKTITGADLSCSKVSLNWQCMPGERKREAPALSITDCFQTNNPAPKTFACRVGGHEGVCKG